jgi:hypothetical protein
MQRSLGFCNRFGMVRSLHEYLTQDDCQKAKHDI